MKSRIDDLEALLDHLNLRENLTLVLHDWGGMIGMAFAARHPERVKRIVASNTGGIPAAGDETPAAIALARAQHAPRRVADPQAQRLLPRGREVVREATAASAGGARRCTSQPYDSPEHRIAVLKFVQTIPLKPTDAGYDIVSDTAASLPKFATVPTLLLWGMKDFVFDQHFLAEWQRHFPHAESHTWPDCGHYLLEDATEEVIMRVREFLANHPLPT